MTPEERLERDRENSRKYREKNPDKVREARRKWYQKNKEQRREYQRKYQKANRAELNRKHNEYIKKDPEKWRKINTDYCRNAYKTKKRHIRENRYDLKIQALENMGAYCRCCGLHERKYMFNLVIDHIKPIRKRTGERMSCITLYTKILDGTLDLSNLQILCQACNTSKSTRERCMIDHDI